MSACEAPASASASGTRSQISSARSSRPAASPWACTRPAAAAACTLAFSAAGWSPAERKWCAIAGRDPDAVGAGLRPALERAREREVQLRVLARQQVVVDDLAQQRVAEAVHAVRAGDDQVRGGGLAQRRRAARRLDRPAASASSAWSARWATASTRRTSCASSGRRSTRTISASRSVGGSAPRPSPPAASSSSANSGLPSLRPYRRSTSVGAGRGAEDVGELLGELGAA